MPDFTRTHYLEIDNGDDGYAYSASYMAMHPDMTMAPEPRYLTIRARLVPEGEVAILRGMQVEALDGRVGEVGELILDPQTGQVSHFLLKRGHLWGKKEVALAVTEIERADEDTIYLKMDKAKLEQLPSLPIKRAWDEVFATDLELMAWTYEAQDQAQKTLKVIEELGKTHAIELLNATIIEKDETGEIKIREKKKAASKRRVTLGIALGGLAGLVVAAVNGRTTIGVAGVRDPEFPCEAFRPKGTAFERVVESDLGWSRCETDGHYMCVECLEISVEALRGREGRCGECGTPLVLRAHERVEPTRCPRCEPELEEDADDD